MIDEPALRAVAEGDLDRLRERLDSGIELDAPDGARGYTLLHVAAQQVNSEAVRLLLASGADPNVADSYGNGPLWTAIFNDREGVVVDLLARAGADPERVNNAGETPTSLARKLGIDLDVLEARD